MVVSAEGGFYRLTIENATLIGETELISPMFTPVTRPYCSATCGAQPSLIGGIEITSPLSTFATRPYCSNCGATYNGLLFDNWYFLPGLNGTILGLKSTRFNNFTFTSWQLGDCEPLALGVHNASNILYISCATNNTVSLRVVDLVHGGEPDIVAFEMNSSVSNDYYIKSRSENPGIFVEYNGSYHFVSSSGNDLLVHKLDGSLVKHLRAYRAPCNSSVSDIAVLKYNASLITRCRNGEIYIFNLHSANFKPINSSLSTEPDSKIPNEILVSHSGSYVAIWSSRDITVFATSSWVFATISDHNNSITSLTFVESHGSVLIVYTVADVGVYTYNVTGALTQGVETVSVMSIPGSKSVCSIDDCLGITSVGSLAVAANIGGGLLFYSFSSTLVTTYGPYFTDYNITWVVPSLSSRIDGYNINTTGTTMTTMSPPSEHPHVDDTIVIIPVLVSVCIIMIISVTAMSLMVSIMFHKKRYVEVKR